MVESDVLHRQRIDKWLWAARFFKTRSMATDAIKKNRVKVDGQKIKASRSVQPGNILSVEKPPFVFHVEVASLHEQRRPAREAQLMYAETAASEAERARLAARLRADRMARLGLAGEGKPSKKQRRDRKRFADDAFDAWLPAGPEWTGDVAEPALPPEPIDDDNQPL